MNKLLLVVNPNSGHGVSHAKVGEIVSTFTAAGFIVNVLFTEPGIVSRQISEASHDYDLVVVCGGDGTLSDVLSAIADFTVKPPVGYIPMGTANDVATTLGIPRTTSLAISIILNGQVIPYDIGEFGDKRFSYISAFGAFTSVSYATPQKTKKALGQLAYVLGGAAALGAVKSHVARVEYVGGAIEDEFVFGGVTNSTSVAGLVRLNPEFVDLGDGLFEVLLVRKPVNINGFIKILHEVSTKRYESDIIRMIHTPYVKFTFREPVAWTRDGEPGGNHIEIEMKNIKHAVRLIVPQQRRPEGI